METFKAVANKIEITRTTVRVKTYDREKLQNKINSLQSKLNGCKLQLSVLDKVELEPSK